LNTLRATFLTVVVAASAFASARADLMPSTGAETAPNFAEITVLEDRVRLALEIGFADYAAFVPESSSAADLAADAEPDPAALSPRTGATVTVRDDRGQPLTPLVRTVEIRDRKPRQTAMRLIGNAIPTPARPISPRVIHAEIDYPFSEQPKRLTFAPPQGEDGVATVTLGFLAQHGRVPITDYRYLSVAETLQLDWADPWFSAFENPNLTRHHKSPLMSFISIEPREVRHEIIFRLRDLEEWTALELGDTQTLDAEQMARIWQAAKQFFGARNPVVIDGARRQPEVMDVKALDVSATGLQVLEDPQDLDRTTALLGIVLFYPQRTLPEQLTMTWELFPDGADTVPVRVTDPAGGVPGQVTPDRPEISWTNFLKSWEDPSISAVSLGARREIGVPFLSVLLLGLGGVSAVRAVRSLARWRWTGLALLAGAAAIATHQVAVLPVPLPSGPPDGQAATGISDAMVRNASTAMLETQPETFEAALGSFVSAPEIGSVGAEMRRGLSVILPSGARARTDTIEGMTIEEITSHGDGLSLLASWTAQVSGGHWGHMHRRNIRYRALMDVEETDGAWMLHGLTVLSAKVEA
jgi:hypothetical protein